MPKTRRTEYDRYNLDFKRLAVALTLHPDILGVEVAERLGLHPVMLYRWRMEMRRGELGGKTTPRPIKEETDLVHANRRIEALEADLAETKKERDLLKKAKRFFQGKSTTPSSL